MQLKQDYISQPITSHEHNKLIFIQQLPVTMDITSPTDTDLTALFVVKTNLRLSCNWLTALEIFVSVYIYSV